MRGGVSIMKEVFPTYLYDVTNTQNFALRKLCECVWICRALSAVPFAQARRHIQ